MKKLSSLTLRGIRGFTLIELVCTVLLLAIIGGIGIAFMRGTADTGREGAGAANAVELNAAFNNLRAAGAIFATGATSITSGSVTQPAVITLAATPSDADMEVVLDALDRATGVTSHGNTATLTRPLTPSSYTYTLDATHFPTFTFRAGIGATP